MKLETSGFPASRFFQLVFPTPRIPTEGYIESVGESVQNLKVGDPVMSLLDG